MRSISHRIDVIDRIQFAQIKKTSGRNEFLPDGLPYDEENRWNLPDQPLTPPEASPLTRFFSMHMNRITTGMIAKIEAAKRYCHSMML